MDEIQSVTDSILADLRRLENIANLDGMELSRLALRLSVNKAYLGQRAAELEFEISNRKLTDKLEWGRIFSAARTGETKITINDAEIVANNATEDAKREIIGLERSVEILKNLRRDASDVITTIQTRIGQLKAEMIEVHGQAGH